ncbi:MAG: DUF1697 domain-containing protein [Acidimicrobiia bacterium]|nr:DUF1697 domain-containing protein [Acidimicrobiia bacterium]
MPASGVKTRYVGFVRNVMIGREGLHRPVLVEIFRAAGAAEPRSYISTGNISFSAQDKDVSDMTGTVEDRIAEVIGRHEPVFVRSVDYLRDLVASDPFATSPVSDPVDRTVSFTRDPLGDIELPVWSRRADVALFRATEREVFAVGRLVDGRTSGGGGLVEKTIGQPVTTRSWNTVLRIVADPGL